jgi:hypothetical protein
MKISPKTKQYIGLDCLFLMEFQTLFTDDLAHEKAEVNTKQNNYKPLSTEGFIVASSFY